MDEDKPILEQLDLASNLVSDLKSLAEREARFLPGQLDELLSRWTRLVEIQAGDKASTCFFSLVPKSV